MKIDVRYQEGTSLLLSLKGSLDRDGARKLTRFLLGRNTRAVLRLELDLGTVDFIGLSAIAALRDFCTLLARRGGSMVISNPSPSVATALSITMKAPCWKLQNPHQKGENKDPDG